MLTLDHLNAAVGVALLALAIVMVASLRRMLAVQQRQAEALEAWLEEQRAANQRQQATEQARAAEAQASLEAESAREQQVVASRQSMADAVATLRQLKRQFG
jgi:DNA-directed RNA polymerase sigma subunit (sigma70/sigma32)